MLFGNLSVFICDIRQFQIHRYLMQWERMPFQFHIAMPWSSYGIEKLNFTLFLLSFECILRKTSWTPFASYLCYLPVNLIFESGTKSNRRASSSFKSHNQKQCANVYVYATSSVHDVQKMKCTEWGEWNADVANAQSAGGGTLNACWKKRIHGKFNLTDEIQVYLVGFVAMYTTSVLRFCLQNTPPAVSIFAVVLRFSSFVRMGFPFELATETRVQFLFAIIITISCVSAVWHFTLPIFSYIIIHYSKRSNQRFVQCDLIAVLSLILGTFDVRKNDNRPGSRFNWEEHKLKWKRKRTRNDSPPQLILFLRITSATIHGIVMGHNVWLIWFRAFWATFLRLVLGSNAIATGNWKCFVELSMSNGLLVFLTLNEIE